MRAATTTKIGNTKSYTAYLLNRDGYPQRQYITNLEAMRLDQLFWQRYQSLFSSSLSGIVPR